MRELDNITLASKLAEAQDASSCGLMALNAAQTRSFGTSNEYDYTRTIALRVMYRINNSLEGDSFYPSCGNGPCDQLAKSVY